MLTRYGFSALYQLKSLSFSDEANSTQYSLQKVYGKTSTLSPLKLDEGLIVNYFKYSAAQTKFLEITNQAHKKLGSSVDAIIMRAPGKTTVSF